MRSARYTIKNVDEVHNYGNGTMQNITRGRNTTGDLKSARRVAAGFRRQGTGTDVTIYDEHGAKLLTHWRWVPTMSLDFNLKARPEGYLQTLPETVQQFYWNVLPWWLLNCGITVVTPITIDIIQERMERSMYYELDRIEAALGRDGLEPKQKPNGQTFTRVQTALQMLIGTRTNVGTETKAQWTKRCFGRDLDLPKGYNPARDLEAVLGGKAYCETKR
jgi:hypothetical protein